MISTYEFVKGSSPLLISIPHDGRELATGMTEVMTEEGLKLPDTDWHVTLLYEFASKLNANLLKAQSSRYVVDLNRSANNAALYQDYRVSDVCPTHTFEHKPIYQQNFVLSESDKNERISTYWTPYHIMLGKILKKIHKEYGIALLWDAHSIRSEVPNLFAGTLPVLNIGTNDGQSCDRSIESVVYEIAKRSRFSTVLNGRFKGGFITQTHGRPNKGIHAVQLEVSQRAYMDEKTLEYNEKTALQLQNTILDMLRGALEQIVT